MVQLLTYFPAGTMSSGCNTRRQWLASGRWRRLIFHQTWLTGTICQVGMSLQKEGRWVQA